MSLRIPGPLTEKVEPDLNHGGSLTSGGLMGGTLGGVPSLHLACSHMVGSYGGAIGVREWVKPFPLPLLAHIKNTFAILFLEKEKNALG